MLKHTFKKYLFAFIAFLFIFSLTTTTVLASDITLNSDDANNTEDTVQRTTTLEVVENNVCNIDLGDYANFQKQITEFNETEKSVTLTLTLTNLKSIEESNRNVEIFLVIDNSSSMLEGSVGNMTRKQAVINSANQLVDKLYATNPNVEVGVVGFSSLDTTAGEQEGTINDASLQSELSNSASTVKSAISGLSNLDVGPRTNIEAGLTIAERNFSSDENTARYIILLTDGVPNNAIDGTFSTYSGVVATRTKGKLESLEQNGIEIISAMINLDGERVEPTTQRTYRDLAEEIFGTESQPTTSEYFYITDDEIEDTIVNDIFDSLVIRVDNTLRNITVVDYFPQEIIDNFNFEYVATPNIGTVSQEVDTTNNSITWTIELLSEGETASLSYKLTLKDDYDEAIIDQILPTNTQVDLSGENNGNNLSQTSDVSPTIRVNYEEPVVPEPDPEEPEPQEPVNIVDNTVAPEPLPQTGSSDIEFIVVISLIAIAGIARFIYLKNNKEK